MVEYSQIECSGCFGIFPGNIMSRRSSTRAVGRSSKEFYNPFDPDSLRQKLESETTHYEYDTVLLCPSCIAKQRTGSFFKTVRTAIVLLIIGAALYLYLDRPSFRFSDNQSDAIDTEPYVDASEVSEDISEQSEASIDPITTTETDAGSPDVAAPSDELTTPNPIEEEPSLAASPETKDVLMSLVKQPVPKGNPGNWVNTNDYPSNALKQEREGTVKFTLDIDERGRVAGCEIVGSSGSNDLDEATCFNIQRRARFDPATDASGAAIRSTFTNSVRWQIPS